MAPSTTTHMHDTIDTALADLLRQHASAPFEWGRHDCCQWAARVVSATTGRVLSLPAYHCALGAARVLRAHGGLVGWLRHLGAVRLPAPALAKRGHLVVVPSATAAMGPALAVCAGESAYAVGAAGLVAVPMSQWIDAWRFEPCHK